MEGLVGEWLQFAWKERVSSKGWFVSGRILSGGFIESLFLKKNFFLNV